MVLGNSNQMLRVEYKQKAISKAIFVWTIKMIPSNYWTLEAISKKDIWDTRTICMAGRQQRFVFVLGFL